MKPRLTTLAMLCWFGLANTVRADDASIDVLPEAQVRNGIEFRAGGVGLDEREALRTVQDHYNLWLSFARKGSGAYAADTQVTIQDARGHVVLEVLAEGPLLLVRLPVGHYRVIAHALDDSDTVSQRVTVREKGVARHVLQVPEAAAG